MFVPPFSIIETLARPAQAAVIRLLLTEILRQSAFNETAYLQANPDVAAAVARGDCPSGLTHYAEYGYFEGRFAPSASFDESWYTETYQDARSGIDVSRFGSTEEQYLASEAAQGRNPSSAARADMARWRQAATTVAADKPPGPIERNPAIHQQWRQCRAGEPEPALVRLPVGTLSPKGDVLLGRNGTVFLIGGDGAPLHQYGQAEEEVEAVASAVVEQFRRRRLRCGDRGIGYLQIVIPEKLSLMHRDFPADVTVPTTLLRLVERQAAAAPGLADGFLSGFRSFSQDKGRAAIFRQVDTHLAPYGAYVLCNAILRRLGRPALPELTFDQPRVSGADIGDRFLGILETYAECDPSWAADCVKRAESRRTLGHFGKRQSWRCPDAPNQLKLLVFGNSYCEYAERGQYALSWWFCRLFSRYDFAWSAGIDWDIVEEVKPDLIIHQTVERHLHRVAED